jgi:sterol desaturase/sphingolipid hydroxylase (fatty acid hydroxylase superfamily)
MTSAMLSPESIKHLVNPWSLDPSLFFGLFLLKCAAIFVLDQIVEALVHCRGKPKMLGFKVNHPKVKGLDKLATQDYVFLVVNSMIEFIFVLHVAVFMWESPRMLRTHSAEELFTTSLLLQIPALWCLFAIDDFMYAIAHKIMHHRWFYAAIHKHHHRQNYPTRGYLDAGNEHPFEQVIGLGLLWVTILMVSSVVKLHVITLLLHFLCYAAMAVLNHTQYDIKFCWFGFQYEVACHETHHRFPQTNFAQYFMTWDRMMGTYKEYVSSTAASKKKAS